MREYNMTLRRALADGLTSKAMTKSASVREAAIKYKTKIAFVDELTKIDPTFEKVAWSWQGVWDGVKRYGPDVALTGLMFVPGMQGLGMAGLAARGALGGARAYRAIRGAQVASRVLPAAGRVARTGRAIASATRTGAGTLRAAGQGAVQGVGQVTRQAAPGLKQYFGGWAGRGGARATGGQIGRFGATPGSWGNRAIRMIKPNWAFGGRAAAPLQHAARPGRLASRWAAGATGRRSAARVGWGALGVAEGRETFNQARNTLQGRGVMSQALGASPSQTRRAVGRRGGLGLYDASRRLR